MAAPDSYRPWKHRGASLGYIRRGVFWISRSVHGRRYRLSTGCRTAEAALEEYARWERDPAGYLPRSSSGSGWDDAVVDYLDHQTRVRLSSPRHVEKTEAHLANIGAWTRGGSRVFSGLDSWTSADLRAFVAELVSGNITGRPGKAATVNRHLASIKGFMSWARETKRTQNEADREITMVREDHGQRLPKEVPPAVWRPLLAALDPRWRAAAEVQLGAGLRYGEVARLAAGDIHPHAIHVPRAKGRRARTVPASARTVAAARRLVALGGVPADEGSQFNHRLEAASKRAGVPAGTTTHAFRHTYACVTLRSLLKAGQGLPELQARMGHASLRTTEIYLRAVRAEGGVKVVVGAPI